jgi:hypothetical protein
MTYFRVSLIVTGTPQFETQDDFGLGDGLGSIPQWQMAVTAPEHQENSLNDLNIDPVIKDILLRLRRIFNHGCGLGLTSTELHDLTCFVIHRLLRLPPFLLWSAEQSALSECLRYAIALYMLHIHGPTYYSHENLANSLIQRLKDFFTALSGKNEVDSAIGLWILSIGMGVSMRAAEYWWFADRARTTTTSLGLSTWEGVLSRLESILWLRTERGDVIRQKWQQALNVIPG